MPAENPLNLSETGYIVIECFHIGSFVLAIGMTAIVDFRLLGLILPKQNLAQLASLTQRWTAVGLIVAVFTGFMLFSVDPDSYYTNTTFLIKMACLCLAIILNYTIRRSVLLSGNAKRRGKIVACISLAFWVSIVFCGIFIAGDLLRIL